MKIKTERLRDCIGKKLLAADLWDFYLSFRFEGDVYVQIELDEENGAYCRDYFDLTAIRQPDQFFSTEMAAQVNQKREEEKRKEKDRAEKYERLQYEKLRAKFEGADQ